MSGFPFLSVITLSPIVAAIIILMMPEERKENAKIHELLDSVRG